MSGPMAHAKLGASSASRWLNCPGSIRMGQNTVERRTSKFASQGTAAHELGELCLETGKNAKDFKGRKLEADGLTFIVDDDMIDAVQVYVDHVRKVAGDNQIDIEVRFDLSWLHPNMFGTNDACVAEEFGDLHVFDYKHGAGVPVDVTNNSQLLYYGIGRAYDKDRKEWGDFENVHLHIVQPRCFHPDGVVRTWTVPMSYLKEFADVLKRGAVATEAPDAPLSAGDHCRWCSAAGFCPELARQTQAVARAEFGSPMPEVEKLTTEQISKIVQSESMIKGFLEEVREYALHLKLQGKDLPGLKLVRKRSSREWRDEEFVKRSLGKAFPMEKVFNMKMKTVAQMEKSVGKEGVKDLFLKVDGDLTVAKTSDRRKAVDLEQ